MLVSIITPTYNHERFIGDCIESVLQQTYTQWEMIIIDDGSTDQTARIAKLYCEKDARIKYYYQENVGLDNLSITYNKALSLAKGDLVAILEGDDYWYPNKLQVQCEKLTFHDDIVLSWGKVDQVQTNKRKIGQYPGNTASTQFPFYNNVKPANILNVIFEEFPIPLTWVIRRQKLLEIGGFLQSKSIPTVDRDTLYELSLHGKFAYIDQPLGAYRRDVNQATKRLTVEITMGCCDVIKNFYGKLSDDIKKHIWYDAAYIDRQCSRLMVIAYSQYGRSCLARKEYKEAMSSYQASLTGNLTIEPVWKLRSLIGWLFAFFRLDLESLVKVMGKKTYR